MKLRYGKTFLIGTAFLSITAFWQLYDSIIPLILKETFGVKETARGIIMALDNILALVLLPLFGTLSDKTSTRIGKRMPYILAGTFVSSLLMIFLPIADNSVNFYLFIIMLGGVLVSMGTYRSPAVALMPDVTPRPLRSKANAIINLMGALGAVFALAVIKIFSSDVGKPNYFPVFSSVSILMIVSVVILFATVKENKESALAQKYEEENPSQLDAEEANVNKGKKLPRAVKMSMAFLLASVVFWFMSYNAVTTAFSSYAKEVWGLKEGGFADCIMVATVAAVVSYIPVGFISSRIGRKSMILIGVAVMAAAFAIGSAATTYAGWMILVFVAVGFGWAAINVNSYPMVVEMALGGDIGKYTGLYYTFSMAAQILTPILSGFFLEHVSYRTLFPYSAIFMALAFVSMIFVRHGDNKPVKA
ncbi:MAG: MFS transporter [Clostridia bacterium]|nr:MFS transporter [Clostridia bacterium]